MPLSNSEIVRRYRDEGVPLCDLTTLLRCSAERVKTILIAYDVEIRSRGQAVRAANSSKAEKLERRLARARELGPPRD